MKYDLIIFDLDGTSLETVGDIANALNHTLKNAGLPVRTIDQVRQGIGGGVGNLIRVSVPADTEEAVIKQIIADFKIRYAEYVNVETHPFDGIRELFIDIKKAGMRLAVNSNKIDSAVVQLCHAHFGDIFECIVGERPEFPRKPAPDGALHILKTLDIAPVRALYVGDGDSDIITAKNAGMDCAWVSWGYRKRDELGNLEVPHVFDTVDDLKAFILG